jgi:RNA recognition motif-containing protein
LLGIFSEPKGFAFIEFKDEREADDARHGIDGTTLDGREVRVVFAQEKRKSSEQMRVRYAFEWRLQGAFTGSRTDLACFAHLQRTRAWGSQQASSLVPVRIFTS